MSVKQYKKKLENLKKKVIPFCKKFSNFEQKKTENQKSKL